jgi:integrase
VAKARPLPLAIIRHASCSTRPKAQRLLRQGRLSNEHDGTRNKRDRAILSILLFHALRREELCKLKVKDFPAHAQRRAASQRVRQRRQEPLAADIAAVLAVVCRRSERMRHRELAKERSLDFKGAVLRRAPFTGAHLERASFREACLERSGLSRAYLNKAVFNGAHLEEPISAGPI